MNANLEAMLKNPNFAFDYDEWMADRPEGETDDDPDFLVDLDDFIQNWNG
jgi:hypothetical protein